MTLYIFGIRISMYEIFGQSYMFNFLLFISSIVFSFCSWHRILILSMTSILVLETIRNFGLKIEHYAYTCIIIGLFSIALSAILYYKNGCYEKEPKGKIN